MDTAEGAYRRRWGFLTVLAVAVLLAIALDLILAVSLHGPKTVEVGVSRPCTPTSMQVSVQAARDAVGQATNDGINPGGRLFRHLQEADGHLFDALGQAKEPC